MSIYYPQSTSGLNYLTSPAGPSASGTILTAGTGTAKGSYTQFSASTGFACTRVIVTPVLTTTLAGIITYLIDVAKGAGGSETVVIANLMTEASDATSDKTGIGVGYYNLAIASGTRIALRCAATTNSSQVQVSLTLIAAGQVPGITSFSSSGTSGANGTQIDPGATANTKGSYAALDASTGSVTQFLTLSMVSNTGAGRTNTAIWAIDVATGGAGSETVLIPDLRAGDGAGANPVHTFWPKALSFMTYIAASTRISVRASCSTNNASDRVFQVVLQRGTAPSETSTSAGAAPFLGALM